MKIVNVLIDASGDELELVAHYDNGATEVIDTAEDMEEAAYLQSEYQVNFGITCPSILGYEEVTK